jgi:purine-nucleoside phosphorylase
MSPAADFAEFADAARAQPAEIGVVLGSGMSAVTDRIDRLQSIAFGKIPGLAHTSVAGHRGCLTLGAWAGRRALIFEGRLHYYEGHSWERVLAPVRVAAELGVRTLLLTNAAGGIHDALEPGSLMAITDHVEWTRPYCWRHAGKGGLGPARPPLYSPRVLDTLAQAAARLDLNLHRGIYAAVTGPSYETPAEIRALKQWGADAVGMSTAREIQAGYDLGLECGAISCITNRAAGLGAMPLNHEEVLQTVKAQGERLSNLLECLLENLRRHTQGDER